MTLKPGAESRLEPVTVSNEEILLREDLLDKQVVDTFGAKIERVNDVHLIIVNRDLRTVHVDFGPRGILRRLGWLKTVDRMTGWLFAYTFPEKMISWKYVQPLASDPKKNLKLNVTLRKLHELHPSDIADIIEELDQANRSSVFKALDLETAAETLQEIDPKLQLSLLETASDEKLSDILEEMEPDEATDILADLPEEKKQKLMRTMEKPYRQTVEDLLRVRGGDGRQYHDQGFHRPAQGRDDRRGRRRVQAVVLSPGDRGLHLHRGRRQAAPGRHHPAPSRSSATGKRRWASS